MMNYNIKPEAQAACENVINPGSDSLAGGRQVPGVESCESRRQHRQARAFVAAVSRIGRFVWRLMPRAQIHRIPDRSGLDPDMLAHRLHL